MSMITIIALISVIAPAAVQPPLEPSESSPTVVCVVNEGVQGAGHHADAAGIVECSDIMACIVTAGIPGSGDTPDGISLVVCYTSQQ